LLIGLFLLLIKFLNLSQKGVDERPLRGKPDVLPDDLVVEHPSPGGSLRPFGARDFVGQLRQQVRAVFREFRHVVLLNGSGS
jgi:hypothetical protein